MQKSYLKALKPYVTIKVSDLDGKTRHKKIAEDICNSLMYKYKTYLDNEGGVIYVGKGI